MSKPAEYIIDRSFSAPRDLVWRAWTDTELLPQWYGPGADTIIHKFELKPGGLWLGEMRWGDKPHFSKIIFQEVQAPEKLVWHDSTADADWNIIDSPMMPDWPRTMSTTVLFEDKGASTNVRLIWSPFEANDAEIACFEGAVANMGQGWESGFAIMDTLLTQLQA